MAELNNTLIKEVPGIIEDAPVPEVINPREVVLHYTRSDDDRNAVFNMTYHLMQLFKFHTPAGDKSDIWVYNINTGIWIPKGKEWISEIVTRSMSEHFKSIFLSEVVKSVRNLTRDDDIVLGGMAPNKIVMANGVYDLETNSFIEFDPDDYQIIALSYDYDPEATCPRFVQFLEEVCPNEEERLALAEWMGYCLLRSHKFHRFLILVGSGSNGKSKFLGILKEMLDVRNVSGISLQLLAADKFMAAHLQDKLANICPDIPKGSITDTSIVKSLTGQDLLTVQKKMKDAFELENRAKLLFSANQIPQVMDSSDAWYRRVHLIEFPISFKAGDGKIDPDLGTKLSAEIQGIWNHSLEGLKRLIEQGDFTGAKGVEATRIDYLKRSDALQYFIHQVCKMDPDAFITVEATYAIYRKMAIKIGRVPVTKGRFCMKLLGILDYVDESQQMKIGKKNAKVYAGLAINLKSLAKELGISVDDLPVSYRKDLKYSLLDLKRSSNGLPENNIKKKEEAQRTIEETV